MPTEREAAGHTRLQRELNTYVHLTFLIIHECVFRFHRCLHAACLHPWTTILSTLCPGPGDTCLEYSIRTGSLLRGILSLCSLSFEWFCIFTSWSLQCWGLTFGMFIPLFQYRTGFPWMLLPSLVITAAFDSAFSITSNLLTLFLCQTEHFSYRYLFFLAVGLGGNSKQEMCHRPNATPSWNVLHPTS